MKCKTCPKPSLAVQRPPVACKGSCNKLIHWTRSYCPTCSTSLKKCEHCGKDV